MHSKYKHNGEDIGLENVLNLSYSNKDKKNKFKNNKNKLKKNQI